MKDMFVKRVVLLLTVYMLLPLIFTACCEERYRVVTDEVTVSFSQYIDENNVIDTDTISGAFIFNLYVNIEQVASLIGQDFTLNSLHALSCGETYENQFVESTASVSLNRSILVNGVEFEAGSNLMDLDARFSASDHNAQVGEGHIRIWFKERFIEVSDFEEGSYEVTSRVETENGDVVESLDTIYFDF